MYSLASMLAFMLYDIIINLKQEVGPLMLLPEVEADIPSQIPLVWCHRGKNDPTNPQHRFRKAKQVFMCLLFIFARYYGLVYLTCVILWPHSWSTEFF